MKTGYHDSVANEDGIYCFRCNEALVSDKVFLKYLTSAFPTQLLKCPKCELIYISEEMVMKKALEVERTIEEK